MRYWIALFALAVGCALDAALLIVLALTVAAYVSGAQSIWFF